MAKKTQKFDPQEFLATVNRGRSIAAYRKGEAIFTQGEPADAVFYIRMGKVKIATTSSQGKEAIVGILGEGDFFGEGCLIGRPIRLASAIAMTECKIKHIAINVATTEAQRTIRGLARATIQERINDPRLPAFLGHKAEPANFFHRSVGTNA